MLAIVQSIFDMTGELVKLPADEDTATKVNLVPRLCRSFYPPPEPFFDFFFPRPQRVDKIFSLMDLNHDHQRTFLHFSLLLRERLHSDMAFISHSYVRGVQGRKQERSDNRAGASGLLQVPAMRIRELTNCQQALSLYDGLV